MRGILVTALLACLMAFTPVAKGEGPTPEDVTFVQGLLKRFGYNPGPIDGICGDLTVNAVRAFHRDRNLTLKPGDIEPQAATVAGNLMTAFTDAVMRPEHATAEVYREALAGDADAAVAVGKMYQQGEAVNVDHMLTYAWWSVAETSGHPQAEDMKRGIVSDGLISQHEMTYAKALAEKIYEVAKHSADDPSSTDIVQPSNPTM